MRNIGWVLHVRHARHGVGHYQICSPEDSVLLVCPPMLEQGPSELEKVLEPIRNCLSVADNFTSHVEEVV